MKIIDNLNPKQKLQYFSEAKRVLVLAGAV
jgi:hypothetical protein